MISYCGNEDQGVGCRSTRRNCVWRLRFRSWGVLRLLGTLMLLLLLSEAHNPFDGLEAQNGKRSAMGESVKAGNHDLYTVSNLASATGHSKAATGRAGQGQCKTDDCQDFDFLMRDDDRDGRVTREEFAGTAPHAQAGATNEAFACLDTDMNGYVTREERDALKTRFFKSHLSKLNEEEVMEWLTYNKCMPTDLSKYVNRIKAAHLNGLALWEVGVKNPSLLKVEFGIVSPLQRRTIVQAICREIEGLGCLGVGRDSGTISSVGNNVDVVNPQDTFFMSTKEGGRDTNHDGQVSKAEFTKEQGPGSAEAFSCLDPDDDGQITREEMFELKTRFFRSRLSHLTVDEVRAWVSSQKCVPIDMSDHLAAFRANEVNGLSLWKFGVKTPSLLRIQLGIQSEIKRATLTQAICREIEGHGCLEPASPGKWLGSDDKDLGSSWVMNIMIVGSLALSIICPLFRGKMARDFTKMSQDRLTGAQKAVNKLVKRLSRGVDKDGTGGKISRNAQYKRSHSPSGHKEGLVNRRASSSLTTERERDRRTMRRSESEADMEHRRSFSDMARSRSVDEDVHRSSMGRPPQVMTSLSDDWDTIESANHRWQSWSNPEDNFDPGHSPSELRDLFLEEAVLASFPKKGALHQGQSRGASKIVESFRSDATSSSGGTRSDGTGSTISQNHSTQRTNFFETSIAGSEGDASHIDGGKLNKKQCHQCHQFFSTNTLLRKFQRRRCKTCGEYFCSAHKKRTHHGCPIYMQEKNQAMAPYLTTPPQVHTDESSDDNGVDDYDGQRSSP